MLFKPKPNLLVRKITSLVVCIQAIVFVIILYMSVSGQLFSYGAVNDVGESVFKTFFYIGIFVLSIIVGYVCYNESIWLITFYCSGGYAVQHMAKNITLLVKHF